MKRKNEQGFTLVEVIVVAVIVAVLAAVAIPLYNGYIRDSRVNVCQNNAAGIASSITAALQQDPNFDYNRSGVNFLSVPSASDNTVFSNINLPADYTFSADANGVIVNGPGNTNSTAVPFRQ